MSNCGFVRITWNVQKAKPWKIFEPQCGCVVRGIDRRGRFGEVVGAGKQAEEVQLGRNNKKKLVSVKHKILSRSVLRKNFGED